MAMTGTNRHIYHDLQVFFKRFGQMDGTQQINLVDPIVLSTWMVVTNMLQLRLATTFKMQTDSQFPLGCGWNVTHIILESLILEMVDHGTTLFLWLQQE